MLCGMVGKHSHGGLRKFWSPLTGSFIFGVFLIAGSYLLGRAPNYVGVATIAVGLVVGILTALSSKDDLSKKLLGQCVLSGCAGVACAGASWALIALLTRQTEIAAAPYINALNGSNQDVKAFSDAKFSVTIPSGYHKLTLYLSAADGPDDNCANGSLLSVTPSYGAMDGATNSIAPGVPDPIDLPSGAHGLTVSVQFIPQQGFNECHEDILAEAASNFSR